MPRQIRLILLACGAVGVCVVAALAFVLTRGDPAPAVPAEAPPAVGDAAAQEEPEPALPVRLPPGPVPGTSADASTDGAPGAADIDERAISAAAAAAEAAAEAAADAKREQAIAGALASLSKKLELTPDQVEAAGPVMEHLEAVVRSVIDLGAEMRDEIHALRQNAREQGLSTEQARALEQERMKEMVLERQGELLDVFDGAITALDGLRPHLGEAQVGKLDAMLTDLRQKRTLLTQGVLKGI